MKCQSYNVENINISHDFRLMENQGRVAKGKKGMGWLTNFTQVRQGPRPSVLEIRSNIMV